MKVKSRNGKYFYVDDWFDPHIFGKWYSSYQSEMKKYYVCRPTKNILGKATTEYLHHYIIGKPFKGWVIDHIDGNPLNNRNSNLRIVTHRQNLQNKQVNRDSKLCGAYWREAKGKWQASMRLGKRTKSLGYFLSAKEAHDAYMKAST